MARLARLLRSRVSTAIAGALAGSGAPDETQIGSSLRNVYDTLLLWAQRAAGHTRGRSSSNSSSRGDEEQLQRLQDKRSAFVAAASVLVLCGALFTLTTSFITLLLDEHTEDANTAQQNDPSPSTGLSSESIHCLGGVQTAACALQPPSQCGMHPFYFASSCLTGSCNFPNPSIAFIPMNTLRARFV